MIATEAEMVSAKLPLEERDYCAHKKIDYLRCYADHFPFVYKCAHEKHAEATCLYEEWVINVFIKIVTSINLDGNWAEDI